MIRNWIYILSTGLFVIQSVFGSTIFLNNCSEFSTKGQFISIVENEKVGTILFNVSGTEARDSFKVFEDTSHYIKTGRNGSFGIVSLKKELDYEAFLGQKSYRFKIQCKGPKYQVTVRVVNIIEGNLTFSSAKYNVSVKEDVSKFSVILSNIQVRLVDPGDNGLNPLQFQVEESYLEYFFLQLDQNQPLKNARLYKLKLKQQLNYSSESPYKFTAVAFLEGHSDKNATAHFKVYVEDVDNQNPKFTKKSYEVDVAESPSSTPVTTNLTVQAIDQDTGINTPINYRLVQEIPSKGWFSVDKTSGAIKVIKSPDRETCSQLTLFIKGYQVNNEALRYDVTWVDVTITDVDDNPPVIEKSVYNISIPENSPTGTNIVQVLATDKDEGINANFTYNFISLPSCNGLVIDQATGMIRVQNSAELDREKQSKLSCQVTAKGIGGRKLLSNASSITVNLVDENDNNPVFNMTEYSFVIKKNHTVKSFVGEVRANDKDLASDISYRVTDKYLQTFLVDSKTGKITLDVSLTENFSKLYSFEIVASDGDKKAPRYTSVIVNVHVQDVNLHAPEFTQKNYHLNLKEDVAVGTDLILIEATDKDPDDTLTYRTTKSNSHFKINSTSGMLSLVKSLDYEVDHSHSINITVTDSVHNTSTPFSVTVLDINDNAPKFQSKSYIFTNVIEEDSNRNVGTVLATDMDGKGNNSEITYSIELPWKANFSIGNGGKITVIGKLDRESIDDTEGHIKFVVIATDHGQPSLTGTTEVTVEVTDINDNCPYINTQDLKSTYLFKELETPKDFHHIQVEDMDKTDINRQMTYSFIGSHDGFIIDKNSGNLSATKALEMEHTNNGQIKLTISVSNNPTCTANITATQTIVINVQDINRYSPQFTPITYSLNVKENYTVGSKLDALRINATDRDTSSKYNTITYWIGKGDPSGHFYMDSKTAEIYLVKPLDYENQTKFVITIDATDGHALYNGTSINATGSVTINVQNVNDNTPKFNQDVYVCKFDENSQTSKNGCTVQAKDGDKDTLSYRVNNTMFKINHLTGDITVSVAKGLDYDDGVHKYMLQVLATDNGRPKLTGTAVVEVDVLNLNDNSPSFSNKTYTFKVMEDASVLTMVGIIQASDKDGDKLKYSIASNKPEFSLDSDTGLLTLKSSLIDKTSIIFTVQAKDSNKTGTATVTVNVIDVNNHPPKFVSPVYTRTLPENVDADVVTTVKATDLDNSPENRNISYIIESAWRQNFTIDTKNGVIKVRGHLDREVLNDRGLITFAVMATDQGNPPLTGTTTVTVTVTDKNDNCPYYDDEDKEVTYVFEEYAKPQNFHDFMAKDNDKTQANRNSHYVFEGLDDLDLTYATVMDSQKNILHAYLSAHAPLRIQGKVKQVNYLKFLSFNSLNNCTGKLKPAVQKVKIIIQDVNDYSPRFNSSKYLFTVEEDAYQTNHIKVGSVHAYDKDATVEYNTVHYGISNGNSRGKFYIDKLNGDILLVKKLDYETEQNYTLLVTATDGKPFNKTGKILTSTVTVEITVNDINDNPPVFDKDLYKCTVSENSTGLIAGCNLIVTDLDTGINGQSQVSVKNDTGFQIKKTGSLWQVEVVRPLDFDMGQKIYYLNVTAEDKETPSLHSSVLVEVVVTNINDNEPYFISTSYTFTIPEDIETNVLIGRVMADDVDHDNLTFSVSGSGSNFKVDYVTGNIYTNAVFVNKLNSLYFHVGVFDGSYTSTTNVTVHIEDVNNNVPHFLNSSYHFSVVENVNNTLLGRVQAKDSDKGNNSKIQYTLLSSEWEHNLKVNIQTGAISVSGSLDREQLDSTNGKIYVVVMAIDQGTPPLTGTSEVIIEVKDVNDNCPKFPGDDRKYTYLLTELTKPVNFHIADAIDKDSDVSNNGIVYSLISGGPFFIIHQNGSLSAKQNLKMENTAKGKFKIVINAKNSKFCGHISHASQEVEVVLEDVNNHSPKMAKRTFSVTLLENFITGSSVMNKERIKATDADTDKRYNTVTYWITSGNNNSTFVIDHYTGDIILAKQLDYDDGGKKSYTLVVSAIDCLDSVDGHCNHSDTATVNIGVTDINDNKPTFTKGLYDCTTAENMIGTIPGCKISATDKDSGQNSNFTFKSMNANYSMTSTGGVILNSKLDYESGQTDYTVIIEAIDKGKPSLTGSATIVVHITDINDNPPVFGGKYDFSVPENEPIGSLVGIVMATDLDADSTLKFSLLNHSKDFTINNNGLLQSKMMFDYEKGPTKYNILVKVSDGKHNVTTTVSVNILNINDNPPQFTQNTYNISVMEDVKTKTIQVMNATDLDNLGSITYSIVGGDVSCHDVFSMASSGILYINDTHNCLDYELRPVHTLLVQASDGTPFSHTSRALIMINLEDRDNKPPEFYWKTYTATIKENSPAGSSVVKVGASDPDSTKLIYTAVNYTDEFEFQQNMLVTKKEIDAEVHQRYTVNISVSDGSNGHDYATVDVLVEDVNDNVPFFTSSLKNFSIPANALGNRRVGQLTVKDKDISNRGFTFYLANEDHFRIDNITGELFVMDDHVKFQANVVYNMTVNVMDHGQPPLTTSAEINIFIDITNHNPPKFINGPYSKSLKENTNINSSVITVQAEDKDPGDAGVVRYKLVPNSKYYGKFYINENSGEITLVGKLDYEGDQFYELTVLAIDKADDPKTAITHVQIHITNVNEKPQFLEKMDGLCVKSPITKDQLVAIVNARDPDANDVLSYSLNDTTNFRIGNESGEIRAKHNVASNLTISVIVKDKGGLMDTKEIELYNNPSLVITPAIITVDVTENSTDHYITKVNASSKQTLTYTLFNSTGFTIDSNGTITSDGPLDRETETKKITVIHVQVNSSSSSCLAQVNINIQDINDNPPQFGFQYDTKTIPENLSTGTCFFPLPVEDPDLNTKLNFSIIEDDSHGKFKIQPYSNQTGGCLVLKTSLDYESMPDNLNGLYSLKAEVSDGKYSSTREIKVHIQDINDNDPIFNQTQYYAEISENVPQYTSIIHMTAYDKDALDEGKLKYSLEGDDSMYFIIQNSSHFGDLEVNTNLNRENRSSYTVTIIAHDSDGHTGSTNVSITILDVNEFKPKFNKDSYLFETLEGPSSKGFDMVISTSDPDLGENGTNSFTLINDYGGLFNITTLPNNTGVITVLKELDRESQNSQKENGTAVYRLHVKAEDHGIPAKSEVTVVVLHVEDINDCKPQFTQPHYHTEVLEGSHKGFSILTVTATDCDYLEQYNNITFSLTGTDSDLFEINNSGEIHLNTTISVQSHKDKFNLTIVATDSANTNQVPLTVLITDVNDHDPVFTHPIYNFSTPETDGTGDIVVGLVSATDEDLGQNGIVTYSIISIDVQHVFNISQDGTITVIGELDRDQCISNRYPFTVIARDNGPSKRTGYTEVIVYVTDINDNSPIFTEEWYNGTVLENSPDDTEVNILPPIRSTDADSGKNGTKGIRYSIIGTGLPFDINEITGAVFTNGSGLDRESQPEYTIQVKAADRYGLGNSNIVMVTITLLDVNDEPPQFTKNNYIFSVNESAVAGQKVGVVMATDEDVNGNTTTRYRIGSGSDGKFYVDILSGVIYTSGGLDREKKAKYEINIEAFDGQQKTNSTVTVYIEDANDNCPVFKPHKLVVQVPENTQNASVVYNLTATDIDQGENAAVSFYLNSSDTSPFIISGDNLILDGALDREMKDEYSVKIYAKDNGIPACVVSSYLEVHVKDINDNSPIFYNADGSVISQADATIIEKSPVGSPILLPSVKDNDIGENAEVEFSLSAEKSDILKYFGISKKTGVVTIKAQVDLNSLNRLHVLDKNATKTAALEMWVIATDKGKPNMLSALNLTVTVEGINDQAPVFLSPEYDITIPENVTIGSVVGTVEAIVENGTNHKLHYSLITNSESSKFFSVAEISGNITTVATIDREKTPAFHFAVQVKDGKIPERTAYSMVSVTVTDVNDNHPEFKQRSYEYIIEENVLSPGISVTATDADSGENGRITYSLVKSPGHQFLLNKQTGVLSVNGTLDREEETCYNLTVLAVDHGSSPLSSSVEVMVTVTDQNDNTPKFTTNNRTYYVKENQHPGQYVCVLKAEDPDNGVNGSVIYMFSGNAYPQFDIDPMSGKITTLVSLDYEVKSVYNLTVIAMDLGTPSLNSTFDLTIMVQDEYDTAPQFPRSLYERTIDVNTPTSTVILGVTAGQYIKEYKIEDGNNGNHFGIDPASGIITLSSRLGTSVLEYKLNISATDHIQTKYTQVLIHVTTNFVQMKNNTFTATIPENMNTTTQLIDLNYTDGSNTVFSYQLIQIIPDVKDTFILNQTTGELYCIKQLDREDINQYTFYIRAVPSSNRAKRSVKDSPGDIKVVVYVQDENDNSPRFSAGPVLTMGVSDTTSVGDLVITLKAEDVDIGDIIQHHITGGQDKDSFSIENSTGKIYSRIKVEDGKTYTVIVTASDGKFSTDITVKFLVISSSDKVVLTIPIPLPEFESKSTTILRNISHIVGFKVELEKSGVHVDSKTHLDWSKTDIYFHGINETGGFILPQQTSFRFKRSHTTAKDKHWELNSINSSHANGSVVMRQNDNGYINPAFTETRFTEREDQLPATNVIESETVRRKREYESQEVVLDLPLEPIDAGLQPPVIDGAREMSLNGYDSGLENEIDSTSSASGNAEDALQDKEIRIETVVEGSEKGDTDNLVGAGPSHGQDVFTFDMETGDTDDDIDDDEVEDNGIKRRKSSKKKFNKLMTVFPSKIEASDTDTDDNPDQSSSHKHLSRKTDSELEGSQDQQSGEIICTKEDSNSDLKQNVKFETLPDQNEQINKAENDDEEDEEGEIEITSF